MEGGGRSWCWLEGQHPGLGGSQSFFLACLPVGRPSNQTPQPTREVFAGNYWFLLLPPNHPLLTAKWNSKSRAQSVSQARPRPWLQNTLTLHL